MAFSDRISNGWQIAKASITVLREHPRLLVFPILSGLSLAFIFGSIALAWFGIHGFDDFMPGSRIAMYGLAFGTYLVNYFVIIFFNMALMHCARSYFDGGEVSISAGLRFSLSRIGAILSWAVFAATVGTILKAIQDNVGWVGKIIVGLFGIAWGISTFFVVPILAYENVGPVDALKRSAAIMKERWGERLTAGFSFGLFYFLVVVAIFLVAFAASTIHIALAIAICVTGIVALVTVMSAVNSIFIAAVYSGVKGNLKQHFDEQMLNHLFIEK